MINPKDVLVDVIALSKKRCKTPIQGLLAYATKENFLGRVVNGYKPEAAQVCLLAEKAAASVCDVHNQLLTHDVGLFIFDAYRPLRAVQDFAAWFREMPANSYEVERKELHYPRLEKTDLVRLGYAPDTISRHCFGSAVDVSIISLKTGKLLNMGAIFDYFDEISHLETAPEVIGKEAYDNRKLLVNAMQQCGFNPYPVEYWHYDYAEQEVELPMDIEIELSLEGLGTYAER